jgi:hypothetical protein
MKTKLQDDADRYTIRLSALGGRRLRPNHMDLSLKTIPSTSQPTHTCRYKDKTSCKIADDWCVNKGCEYIHVLLVLVTPWRDTRYGTTQGTKTLGGTTGQKPPAHNVYHRAQVRNSFSQWVVKLPAYAICATLVPLGCIVFAWRQHHPSHTELLSRDAYAGCAM